MARSPSGTLAGGRLAGDNAPPAVAEALDAIADREGVDRATAALAFALAHPSRPVVLVGSTNVARIAASTRGLEVRLDRADVYRIVQAATGEPVPKGNDQQQWQDRQCKAHG